MNVYPLSMSDLMTNRTCSGAARMTARSRANSVPSTASAFPSRSSCAISSRPVASGTGDPGRISAREHPDRGVRGALARDRLLGEDLLGADRVVALAPAGLLGRLDLLAQADDAVRDRL